MNVLNTGGLSFIPTVLAVVVGAFFVLAAFAGIFVVIVVANRADPDPTGRRPVAVYLFGVSFFSVFVVLFGSFAIVLGLVQLIGSHPAVQSAVQHPVGDAVVRVVVLAGLIVGVAVVLLLVHLRPALRLPEVAHGAPGPTARVAQSYAASVSFVSVFIGAVSIIVFLYDVFRILAPGVFQLTGSRVDAARALLAALYLALASAAVVYVHARLLPSNGFSLTARPSADPDYGGFAPPPPPPPPPGAPASY
jgi:hypothetical protein